MSGRRRRDDGWDDSRRDGDARDNRADPWLVDSADGGAGRGYPAPSFQPVSESATSYDQAAAQTANGSGHNSSSYGSGYRSETGYGDQNGAANGYQSAQSAQSAPGYGGSGYPGSGYGQGGYGNDSGYGGRSGFADPIGATAYVPEFMSDDADDAPAGTPRPIGRLSIYTLLDDRVAEFDRLAERAAEGVRTSEPDTLVYVIHVVPKAPMQRIMYEIYRDRAAFESHERQPHIQRFVADRASCVLATNIIDLRLKYAKVTALGAAPADGQTQGRGQEAQQGPRPLAPAAGGDRSRSEQYTGTQYGNGSLYNGGSAGQYGVDQTTVARPQYSPQAAPAAAAPAASFTPAGDHYGAAGQYPATASGQYAPAGQYGYPGAAANGGQYSAAQATAYPTTSGYSETGAYPGTGYQATGTYQASGAYQATGGYPAGAGYPGGGGYSGGAGNPGGAGSSGGAGSQGSDGYQAANGYAGSSGYSGTANHASFTPVGAAGSAAGQSTVAAQVAAARRYREIGSGAPADGAGGDYQAPGPAAGGGYSGRDADAPRDSAEWAPPAYSDQRYRSS
jgi:quinol monooxygenase YgiN